MRLSEATYAACSIAFLALIALMLLRRKLSGPGLGIVVACGLTAIWAADLAIPGLLARDTGGMLDSLRLSSWLILLVGLIRLRDQRRGRSVYVPLAITIAFVLVVVFFEGVMLFVDHAVSDALQRPHDLLRVGLGVGGLLAAENLLRNARVERRRDIWPLCLALGGTFAFELFVYADRLMMPSVSPAIAGGRGLVGIFAVPLLALAMARNREWRVDIHVSRALVLHTVALVASGAFFLSLAALGLLVREMGGVWGPHFQLLTLLGSAIVLVAVVGSHDIRVWLKRFVAQNLFSHRFDYRTEWLRFAETMSQPGLGSDSLHTRVIRALAQILDSRSGCLWCLQDGLAYAPETGLNLAIERGQKLAADHPFILGFRDGSWIQERPSAASAAWPFDATAGSLAIPLSYGAELIAFVILAPPTRGHHLDWESFDLLRAAARQAASYIAEERSTRALMDSRLLNEYSKRFAFVIHDIKNLASQLGMVVSNAHRYIDNPEFRGDMLQTLEDSVGRMHRLIAQLHGENHTSLQFIEPDTVVADLARELRALGTPIQIRLGAPDCRIAISSDQFRSVMLHLINNAREAAQSATSVVVASRISAEKITIDVVDTGPGMDDEFIHNELFRPFRSTKPGGLGIGGYQTRELLRSAGGAIEVISEKGVGTIMRVTFPTHDDTKLVHSAA